MEMPQSGLGKLNPRSSRFFESFRDFGVLIGVQRCGKSRDFWRFFDRKERVPFMGSEFTFNSKVVVLLKACMDLIIWVFILK